MPVMAVFLVVLTAHAQPPRSDVAVSDAIDELKSGRVYEAIAALRDVLARNPASSQAHFYLATIYTEMGEYPTAEAAIGRAIALDPAEGLYVYQRGQIHFRRREWPRALEAFRRAIGMGISATEAVAWRRIGEVQAESFNWDRALEAYARSVGQDPGDAASRLGMGRILLKRDSPAEAAAELETALRIDPTLSGVHAALGRAYRRLGEGERAIDFFRAALQRNPADQEARYGLARTLLTAGRVEEGRRMIDEHRRIDQTVARAEGQFESAMVLIEKGHLSEARALLEQVRLGAPAFSRGLHALGVVLRDLGDTRGAIDALGEALRLNPVSAAAYHDLATALRGARRFEDALDAVRRSIVLDDDDPAHYMLLAEINGALDRPEDAEAARRRADRLRASGKEPASGTGMRAAR
jgi:tetratricopeptide (TPR) repeat protein